MLSHGCRVTICYFLDNTFTFPFSSIIKSFSSLIIVQLDLRLKSENE